MADPGRELQDSTLSIGQAEFQRLQSQLIDLRTTNYQLKEHNSKLSSEVSQLQETVQLQSRDLDRAHKTIQRSKKAKELSGLIEENDSLQRKMESQEEDFRLQNRTLMEELAKVCDEKEGLSQELERARSHGLPGGGGAVGEGPGAGQLTHLQAENTALQKSLQALKERLQEMSSDSQSQDTADPGTSTQGMELEVKLATAEEEKLLLQQKLSELQAVSSQQQAELQGELEKWTDKAKKKQDSFLQLQAEKERLYMESRASFNEMARTKDIEIQGLKEQLEGVRQELAASRATGGLTEETTHQLRTLSTEKEELTLRCAMLKQEREALVGERDGTARLLEELGGELQQSKAQLGEEKKAAADLFTQLEEAKMSQEQLADQVVRTSEEKHNLLKEVEAAQKLAAKRKALLDEMAIKEQHSATEQRRRLDEAEEKLTEKISRLEEQLLQEQARSRRLAESSDELPGLRAEVGSLQERLSAGEEREEGLRAAMEREREEHVATLEAATTSHNEETEALRRELEGVKEEVEECREKVVELEQAVQDKQAQVKIVERKSQSLLKDLKRQLQAMHKREERLLEQVAELRGGGHALDQYFSQPPPSNSEHSHDSASRHSRESSLSSLKGVVSTDGMAAVASPTTSAVGGVQFTTQQSNVSEETRELLARIAELQQEKWTLEERVNHLETTGSALAEDVIQKSEIIKSFYVDSKSDHHPSVAASRRSVVDKMSPLRLVQWARGKDETTTDINRKMQNALEEALTKNIHLQENIDMLSGELQKHTSSSSPLPQRPPSAEAVPTDATEQKN